MEYGASTKEDVVLDSFFNVMFAIVVYGCIGIGVLLGDLTTIEAFSTWVLFNTTWTLAYNTGKNREQYRQSSAHKCCKTKPHD